MFVIWMPRTFKVGDTADVKINGEPKRVTYRDPDTLVIEPGDARTILGRMEDDRDLVTFACSDAEGDAS